MKILKLENYKKEQKNFDHSRLHPKDLERLDYFIKVMNLGLLDRLSYVETRVMHHLIDLVTVKSNEELLSDIEKKVDKLNDAVKKAAMQDLNVSMEERTEMDEGKPFKIFSIKKVKDQKHKRKEVIKNDAEGRS